VRGGEAAFPLTARAAYRLSFALLVALAAPAWGQKLLYGSWQAKLDQSVATLTVITVDSDGWLHGVLHYEPPQPDGFAGSPFVTQIQNGGFSFRLDNGTSFRDMYWCAAALCGRYVAPDDSASPVLFVRPGN